ncbi:reverse transcriptase [Gossypium australe]|uniref:Reverse transcriptase n=1 Tax=Gossypium australe TaxID=47621 RepID=A0A5B6VYF1_9ROSI|nr:reverse transcriptase [Gossypium australe]
MEVFRDTLEECHLMDIGYSGVRYTWERETNIRERLDRGVANEEWLFLFPIGNIQYLPFFSSDHCPILLNTDISTILKGHRSFRFEARWTMEGTFEGMIREFWDSSPAPLMEKLSLLQIHLKKWADTKIHLNLEIDKDEVYWEQRARVNWLKLGDKNTAFFHKCASAQRRINSITKLVSEDGREIMDGAEILEAATGYFEDLFASKGIGDPRKVLEGIESIISHEVNENLLSPFREDEVRSALKDMGLTKALGKDGFPALFFQQYWHIVGKEVLDFCLGILNGNKGADLVNVTEIVLIPKIPNPSSLVNFRPISLCSVLYKIVAKTIPNRMQNVIGMCIDEVQSAFFPGCLINDNVLIAYEILHAFQQKRTGKKGYMTVKLDMSKAYDRVEWDFVKEMMIKMGFAHEWVGLIMKCITSFSYAVNINGYRGRVFQPTRGLRQGDPLSPFLFLICSEGLFSLMRVANQAGLIKGARDSRRGLEISHLLFADDCMMFGEATEQGARNMKDILEEYENCSGQCVNFNKSTIFYSSNTLADAKDLVSSLLGRNIWAFLMWWVNGKRRHFNILDKISLRIDSWSTRLLSQGGKEIFLKSVLQGIPTYAMSCFLLPKTLCESIENKFARSGGRKELVGEAFIGVNGITCADLEKRERVFSKQNIFPDCSFRDSHLGNSSSYVWRSIWAAKASLEMGLI